MNIWYAAIDESGTHSDSEVVVVSAVLGRSEAWPSVWEDWTSTLKQFNVSHYHAVDFNAGCGVAKHLSDEQKIKCVKELISKIANKGLEYLSLAVERKLFEKKINEYSASIIGIYDYLLATLIGIIDCHLIEYSRNHNHAEQGTGIISVESGNEKYAEISKRIKIGAFMHLLGAVKNISFLDKPYIPLQIADMIAYDSYKIISEAEIDYRDKKIIMSSQRKSFELITKGGEFKAFIIDENTLKVDIPHTLKFLGEK